MNDNKLGQLRAAVLVADPGSRSARLKDNLGRYLAIVLAIFIAAPFPLHLAFAARSDGQDEKGEVVDRSLSPSHRVTINIPRVTVESALTTLALRNGFNWCSWSSPKLKLMVGPIQGTFTIEEAVHQLLDPIDLPYQIIQADLERPMVLVWPERPPSVRPHP